MPASDDNGITTKARLNLKIDEGLKEWAKAYAKRHGTDVTKMITAYFMHLREEERKQSSEFVDQI